LLDGNTISIHQRVKERQGYGSPWRETRSR